jgi:hypothetical protein
MITVKAVKEVLGRTIAFHPTFAILGGSIEAGLFLSQACYWTSTLPPERDGWFFKTQAEWQKETLLSRHQQEKARAAWAGLGVVHEKRQGVPAKLWFRIDLERLMELLDRLTPSQASMLKSDNLDCGGVASKSEGNSQALLLQRLPENTAEKKSTAPNPRRVPLTPQQRRYGTVKTMIRAAVKHIDMERAAGRHPDASEQKEALKVYCATHNIPYDDWLISTALDVADQRAKESA